MSTITMTNTDPGEGSPLANDNYIGVYGGKSLLDLFYPVGCFFETTDGNFDPNVAWGGVWEEDTSGQVLVAESADVGDAGDTGGDINHRHDFCIGMHAYYGGVIDDDWCTGVNGSGAYSYSQNTFSKRREWSGGCNTKRNDRMNTTAISYSETCRRSWGDTDLASSYPPYTVVKRWHRTA